MTDQEYKDIERDYMEDIIKQLKSYDQILEEIRKNREIGRPLN